MARNRSRRAVTSSSVSTPRGGSPSTTPTTLRPRWVTATKTSTGFAVAQKIVQTSGTALIGLRTLTGKPSRMAITKQCPAPIANALRVASSTSSGSLPLRRTNRGPEASQKASPNRSVPPTPISASCRSSTVLMKCACPITTFRSSGLSTVTISQESDGVVIYPCCHPDTETQKPPKLGDFGGFCVFSRKDLQVLAQIRLGVD